MASRKVRWLDDVEARAWMGYRRMKGLLDLQIARDLQADSGLSDSDYHVLSTLNDTRDTDWRLRELAVRLLWSPSRLAHHLTRMERRGLVDREPTPGDARGGSIAISKQGRRVIERAAPYHVRSVRRNFIGPLTREQLVALAEIADTVVPHLTGNDSAESAESADPKE